MLIGRNMHANFLLKGMKPWNVYHINCYNVVVHADRKEDVPNWKTIGIREYFRVYEECTGSTLDVHDQNLVTNLVEGQCQFCAFCLRAISTTHQHHRSELTTPFWVLSDIVSCWCFLALYPIGVLLLLILGAIQWIWIRTDYRHQADSHEMNYGIMEQDLSYFDAMPMPTSHLDRDRPYTARSPRATPAI